ncbi:putative PIN and TRAM-domain containing protein precursor [Caulifigura coniformis]|uniref:Putative PIN and TRAM-domain containing protein n=1 Tax=Caulifigura coniformis TaxID=2527983 RepID=A0A517S9R8_9PLAN|nr:PIN/TRAM domain-containing protein [Caulifigura coniformis]QDT52870.1 putative PIN and TRAM-domain containing protein precursor [Caulifigura coniformis]
MLLFVIRMLYIMVSAGAVLAWVFSSNAPPSIANHQGLAFAGFLLIPMTFLLIDILIPRKRVEVMSAIYFGLLIGVLLAYLLNLALEPAFVSEDKFDNPNLGKLQDGVRLLTVIILPYICISFLLQTKDQFRFVIPYVEFQRELKGARPLVLDSSALIDGRIADVVDTNMLDGQILVPQFILHEVQDIADSHDKVRRSRGRRGLDVLRKLQQDPKIDVKVHETDSVKGKSVDQRLIEITREFNGRLVTNDLNLNKLAGVQGVSVVNLNDVANALKPRFLPGEQVRIRVVKEGEGAGQGVGYLDDGTMVVVEQGNKQIGNEIDTVVTSVLQNSAGRMLFCKMSDSISSVRT